MQTEPKTYRLSGLIAVLGVLTLLVGLIVMILLPSIRFAAWGLLALGILLLATAFIIDFRRVGRALTGRRGRFGVSTTVMVSIFAGIILFLNAISIGNYHLSRRRIRSNWFWSWFYWVSISNLCSNGPSTICKYKFCWRKREENYGIIISFTNIKIQYPIRKITCWNGSRWDLRCYEYGRSSWFFSCYRFT